MRLARAITVATVLATAIARPHAALSHEQLFPLEAASTEWQDPEGRDDSGENRWQRMLRRPLSSQPSASHAAAGADYSGNDHPFCGDAENGQQLAPRVLANLNSVVHELAMSGRKSPAISSTSSGRAVARLNDQRLAARRSLEKHDETERWPVDPRGWNPAIPHRIGLLAVGILASIGIYESIIWAAQLLGLSLFWTQTAPLFIGIGAGVLLLWVGNWALCQLERSQSEALGRVRRLAATAGLKVRFVSATAKDALIARANATAGARQVNL
jgi:hypothetical protein